MIPVLPPDTTTRQRKLLISRSTFLKILVLAGLGITGIWLAGRPAHHTLWHNTLVASILVTSAFLLFVVAGLYTGIRPRCTPGKITGGIHPLKRFLDRSPGVSTNLELDPVGDSLAGLLVSLLCYLLLGTLSGIFFWFLHALILCMFGLLFYGFSRALLWIFRHRYHCRGNFMASLRYGVGYTLLYSAGGFGVLLAAHYLVL